VVVRPDREAEVASEEAGHVVDVLQPGWLVEAELDSRVGNHLGRWLAASPQRQDGVAGQDAEDEEHRGEQDEKHRDPEGGPGHRICQEGTASRHRSPYSTPSGPKYLSG